MFKVIYTKDGKVFTHTTLFCSSADALNAGHELTRDWVADFFKVTHY